MGVCIDILEEKCCEYLNDLNSLDGDSFTDNEPTVDNIYECDDKYILIEEKSFLLNFFRESCIGRKKFSHFIKSGELQDDFFDFLNTLDKREKSAILKISSLNLLEGMPMKVKTTHKYLEDKEKIKNSINVILYCKSDTEIDKLASIIFAKYNNEEENTVLECQQLEKFLKKKAC